MKKDLAVAAIALGISAFATQAQAQMIVSDQLGPVYSNHALAATALAGAVSADNWNIGTYTSGDAANGSTLLTYSQSGLVDSNDNSTGISFTVTGFTAYYQGNSAMSTNNAYLLYPVFFDRKGAAGSSATLTVSGLNSTDTYDLYVYVNQAAYDANTTHESATVSLEGGPSYAVAADPTLTAFTPLSATNSDGNYVEFTNLTGSTLQAVNITQSDVGFSGFQLVDLGAIPEPSTWGLFFGGLGALVAGQSLRRRARFSGR